MLPDCACGCGQPIIPSALHPTRKAKFIQGHWSRTRAYRRMKASTRTDPPGDWVPPKGLCECGCGKRTRIAKATSLRRDQYAGFPMRYLRGHSPRKYGPATSNWKGGRRLDSYGYVLILTDGRYRAEHVLVWEAAHGPVPKGKHIHHKNGDKTDNRLANLECLTRSEHKHLHQHTLGAHHAFIPDDELIVAYRMLWRRLRRAPTTTECHPKNGVPHWNTFHRRFGSVTRLRELAHP